MPQLNCQSKASAAHAADQLFEIADGLVSRAKTGRELRQQRAEPPRFGKWLNAFVEDVEVVVLDPPGLTSGLLEHLRMGELLPHLGSEAEMLRHFGGPGTRGELVGRSVKRAVDLDRVEVLGIEGELVLVGQLGWIKEVVPGALALGIAPAGGADEELGGGHQPDSYAFAATTLDLTTYR